MGGCGRNDALRPFAAAAASCRARHDPVEAAGVGTVTQPSPSSPDPPFSFPPCPSRPCCYWRAGQPRRTVMRIADAGG
eukprot:352204-Chlamydomonas_euryale.AAC.8